MSSGANRRPSSSKTRMQAAKTPATKTPTKPPAASMVGIHGAAQKKAEAQRKGVIEKSKQPQQTSRSTNPPAAGSKKTPEHLSSRSNNLAAASKKTSEDNREGPSVQVSAWSPDVDQADEYASLLKQKKNLIEELDEVNSKLFYLDSHKLPSADGKNMKVSGKGVQRGPNSPGASYNPNNYSDQGRSKAEEDLREQLRENEETIKELTKRSKAEEDLREQLRENEDTIKELTKRNQELKMEQKRPGSAQKKKEIEDRQMHAAEFKKLVAEKEKLEKDFKDKEKDFKQSEKKIEELEKKIEDLERSGKQRSEQTVQKEKSSVIAKIDEMRVRMDDLNKTAINADENVKRLQSDISNKDEKISKLNERNEDLTAKIKELKSDLQSRETEKIDIQRKCLRDYEEEKRHLNKIHEEEIRSLKRNRTDENEEHNKKFQRNHRDDNAEELNKTIRLLEMELDKERNKNDQLQNRLSLTVSQSLRKDNPNITDLSDENRPQKLAEKFTMMYDNDWTDLQEKMLMKIKNDKEVIETLRDILYKCYRYCKRISEEHLLNVYKSAVTVFEDGKKTQKEVAPDFTDHLFDVKELRKQPELAKILVEQVKKNFSSDKKCIEYTEYITLLKKKNITAKQAELYMMNCIHLCWFMVIQTPPVYIDFSVKGGASFDKSVFREYTSRGDKIDYVVWPPLYLHVDGPLLQKGVAQGR